MDKKSDQYMPKFYVGEKSWKQLKEAIDYALKEEKKKDSKNIWLINNR